MEQNINVNEELNEVVTEEVATTNSGKGFKTVVKVAVIGLAVVGIRKLVKRIKAKKKAKEEVTEATSDEDELKVSFSTDENGHLVCEEK